MKRSHVAAVLLLIGILLAVFWPREKPPAPRAPEPEAPLTAAAPFPGKYIPNPQESFPKRSQFPTDEAYKKAFNERKAAMTEQALKDVDTWLKYPLWSQTLGENMRYHPPEVSHNEMKGPGDVYPSAEVYPEKLYYWDLKEPVRIFAVFKDSKGNLTHPDTIHAGIIDGSHPRPHLSLDFADRGDGVMVATLPIDAETARRNRGEWAVHVDSYIEGQRRGPTNVFYLMLTDAKVTGPYRVALENGSLVAYVGIDASHAGIQHLKGELWGPKGEAISYAWVRNDSTPLGPSTMKLTFYGKVIRDSGVDGPYEVKNLLLTSFDENYDRIEDPAVSPGITSPPWSHNQFTDVPINGDNAILNEKKKILGEELDQARAGLYDPNDPIPARPTTVAKDSPPPQ